MKLFVYCPSQYYEQISPEWEKALDLSKKSKLPIVSNIDSFSYIDSPSIIAVPDKKYSDIDDSVKSGFTHKIDITDEFCTFAKDVIAEFVDPDGVVYEKAPILRESHRVKFRTRHTKQGVYKVLIKQEGKIYTEGLFTVS